MRQWKFAFRSLVRRPGFVLAVCGLLTLGIGVNTALFSVVDTVLLKPLPYPAADRLVTVYEASAAKSQKTSLIAPGRLEDWNRLNHSFTAITGVYRESVTDTSGAEPERLSGLRVTPRYFEVYGVRPVTGRGFTSDEERAGGPGAAVISYGLWARRYGLDPRVTAKSLIIGGQGYRIVGVTPEESPSPKIDVWVPAQTSAFLMGIREARFLNGVGRMKPGVTIAQAQADLASVQHALGEQYPKTDRGWSVSVESLKNFRVGNAGRPLLLLFGAVALLLSITVTNAASLVLSQLHRREREIAIRVSIGATRGQVVGALTCEMLLVAATSAIAGWGLAALSLKGLAKFFADVPRINELAVDWRALAFAAAVSLLGSLAFGLLPAWRATASRFTASLIRAGRVVGERQRVQRVLVSGQIALTLVLLASAGLLFRSFYNLNHVELGFDPHHVLLFHVGAAWDENRTRVGHMQERILAGLVQLPGVEAAGLANFLPVSGATLRYQVTLDGGQVDETGKMPAGERTVSPGYLQALRAPLLAGGWCPALKTDSNAPFKAMVNRRFVDVYARGGNVVGRHLSFDHDPIEIVGVIGDIKEDAVDAPAYPYVYTCATGGKWPDPEYAVRTAGDPMALAASVRQMVRGVDPNRAIFELQRLEDAFDATLDRPRANLQMLGVFALAAMLLAAVGLYSLIAQMVTARRQEIGVRMALGARPGRIVWALVANAAQLIGAGIAAGLLLTAGAERLLQSVLFGVPGVDAISLGGATLLLGAVSLTAALLPARGAAKVDPVEAMRAE
jgi:putative ABC transport system permease protein